MPDLGTLFIPRKNYPDPPTKPEDLVQWAARLVETLRVNDLAVERWANEQPQSVRVRGSVSTTFTSTALEKVPFDTVDYDITGNMADVTNHRILLPRSGIYLATGLVTVTLPNPGVVTIIGPQPAYIYANGVLSVGRQYEAWADNTVFSAVQVQLVSQYKGSARDYLEVFTQTYAAGTQVQLVEFTVTMIGRTPSKVQ